jgi:exodeoxyribonuclease VII large subunit
MASDSSNGPGDDEPMTNFFDLYRQATRRRAGPDRPESLAAPAAASPKPEPLTVTQLTRQIDRTIRAGMPQAVLVKGELSSYRPYPGSGHHYFTLKDAGSCIDCVMWRDDAARLRFAPQTGMQVLVTGRVQVYVERGKYQFSVTSLEPIGQGALELAFRQLKEKLEKEGLFAPGRKKPLPRFPGRIVIVTSRRTAALQDMLKVLRRYPWVKLSFYNVPVQGEPAGRQIAEALSHLNRWRAAIGRGAGADVILLGRGGGSMEDLACFNDESLARAVAASALPIITGIGHEVDTSIADLVADYHAHTPTEAAQVVMQHWRLARDAVSRSDQQLGRGVRSLVRRARQQLTAIERHEAFRTPLSRVHMLRQLLDDREKSLALAVSERVRGHRDRLRSGEQRLASGMQSRLRRSTQTIARLATLLAEQHPRHRLSLQRQRLDSLAPRLLRLAHDDLLRRSQRLHPQESRLLRLVNDDMSRRRERLDSLARQLEAIGPLQVLRRGFSLTTLKRTGEIIRSVSQIKAGDRLITRFADGQIEWTAEDPRQMTLFQ